MKLEVLISTLGADGIRRVANMNLPRTDEVGYLVGWQMPEGEIPEELRRPDIKILTKEERGLSRNRNMLLGNASAEIVLIADDDLTYTPERLREVIRVFEEDAALELATFRYDGADVKSYPARECELRIPLPKGYYLTSFEMALRRTVGTGSLRFNEKMGLGAEYIQAGEEEMFLYEAIMSGVKARFFPITVTRHEGLTTGNRRLTAEAARGSGVVIKQYYPFSAPLRILLKAWRLYRADQYGFFAAVREMARGIRYGRKNGIIL